MRFSAHQLTRKLILGAGGIVTAIAGLALILSHLQEKKALYSLYKDRGLRFNEHIAYNCRFPIVLKNQQVIEGLLSSLFRTPDVIGAAIYDASGQVLARQGLAQDSLKITGQKFPSLTPIARGFMICSAIEGFKEDSTGILGTACTAFSDQPVRQSLRGNLAVQAAGVCLLSAALAFFLFLFLEAKVLSPLARLEEAAQDYARGHFSRKINLTTGDELEHLADAMSFMAGRLDKYQSGIEGLLTEHGEELSRVRRHVELAQALAQGAMMLSGPKLWEMTAHKLRDFFGCERVTIYEAREGRITSLYAQGLSDPITLSMGQGVAGSVAEKRTAYISAAPYEDLKFEKVYDEKTGFRTRNVLCAPIAKDRDCLGVVELLNKKGGFNEDDTRALETISAITLGFILKARPA